MYHVVWGYVLSKKLFSLPIILQPAFFFFPSDSVFEILLHKYVTILFSQSSVGGQLSGFQLFSVTNNSAMGICADAHQNHHDTSPGTKLLRWRV